MKRTEEKNGIKYHISSNRKWGEKYILAHKMGWINFIFKRTKRDIEFQNAMFEKKYISKIISVLIQINRDFISSQKKEWKKT